LYDRLGKSDQEREVMGKTRRLQTLNVKDAAHGAASGLQYKAKPRATGRRKATVHFTQYAYFGWTGCLRGKENLKTQEKRTMKKIMMLLAAAMLLLGLNGQAMAYFSNGDLIQVVYQGTTEIATDEGSLATLLAGGTTLNFSSPLANAQVAYFDYVITGGSQGTVWTSGNNGGQTAVFSSTSNFHNAYSAATGLYYNLGGPQVTVLNTPIANPNSYTVQMDGGKVGSMDGFLKNADGEATMANGGPVQQTLYQYVPTLTRGASSTGTAVATINTSATPVPPSILLMGSGLLGLAGIGRKRTV